MKEECVFECYCRAIVYSILPYANKKDEQALI